MPLTLLESEVIRNLHIALKVVNIAGVTIYAKIQGQIDSWLLLQEIDRTAKTERLLTQIDNWNK